MKIKTLFLMIVFPLLLVAQEGQQPGIELPDFIITGVQSIDIPVMKKVKPEPITNLSEQFFTPAFSPEELDIMEFSNPIKKQIELFQRQEKFSGRLKMGAGIYTIPKGEFYYNYDTENFLLFSSVYGLNETDFEDNAGYNVSGAALATQYFFSSKSPAVNGLRIGADLDFKRDAFKFYGSFDPTFIRESYNGYGGINVGNSLQKEFQYNVDFHVDGFYLKENETKEFLYKTNINITSDLKTVGFTFSGNYTHQSLNDTKFFNDRNNFYAAKAGVKVKPFKTFNATFGLYYSKSDTNSLFSPTVSFDVKLDNNLILFGEFSPHAEFQSLKNILTENRYYNISDIENLYVEYKANFKIAVKYQFETYFEIAVGAGYISVNGYPYFEDETSQFGKFNLKTVDDATRFNAFVNLLYHLGPMGYLYGEAEFQDFRTKQKMVLPYSSPITAEFIYGYNFDFGLGFKAKLKYAWESYTTMKNDAKLPHYINPAINLTYKISDGFGVFADFENILNRKNLYLSGYREKPFDIIAGLDYRW